jgi:hypothetical protein
MQPRGGCAPSAGHGEGMDARVEAKQEQLPDGPLLYPGPLCGGEVGSTGRAAGVDRDVDSFSSGQEVRSKSPALAHELAGQEPGKCQAGCRFLLVTSLLLRVSCPSPFGPAPLFAHASCVHVDKQKRSNSASTGGRKLFALNAEADKRIARERTPTRGRDVK